MGSGESRLSSGSPGRPSVSGASSPPSKGPSGPPSVGRSIPPARPVPPPIPPPKGPPKGSSGSPSPPGPPNSPGLATQLASRLHPYPDFPWDPKAYFGYWVELGKYPDPGEKVCNDVSVLIVPNKDKPGNLFVSRSCVCHLTNNKLCGRPERFEAQPTNIAATYDVFPLGSNIPASQVRIVWTDYRLSLVAANNRLWIYQKVGSKYAHDETAKGNVPGIPLLSLQDLEDIRQRVQQMGFDPFRVILSGQAVYSLAQGPDKIYTSTLMTPHCQSKEGKRYSLNASCPQGK